MQTKNEILRKLPSVDALLKSDRLQNAEDQYGKNLVLESIRQVLNEFRTNIENSELVDFTDEMIREGVLTRLNDITKPTMRQVINAAGVILHTNLGRAPLSTEALKAVDQAGRSYNTLEFDIENGKRGSRFVHAEQLITQITGSEASMVVNNNAGAVLLILSTLAKKKRVIVSRSQLIEIGGGFRVPDVMKQSRAKLVEIGTTNRVHLKDYRKALEKDTAMIFYAHASNFKISGFTTEPDIKELAGLAKEHDVLFCADLGSGALLNTTKFGIAYEPMVQEAVQAGADIVCFSGDKLLGGPQAGIITGKKEIIEKLKTHPLTRALRPDKLCLSALSATLQHYLLDRVEENIPVYQMLSMSIQTIKKRANEWKEKTGKGEILESFSTIGGGSLPQEMIPTYILKLNTPDAEKLMEAFRQLETPVIARVEKDAVILDPRTVFPEQDQDIIEGINKSVNWIQ